VNMDSSCRNLAFVAEWWWWSGPQLARHACCTKLMRGWSGFQAPLHNSLYHEGHAFYMVLETDVTMWEWSCRAQYQMRHLKNEIIHWGTESFSSLNCVSGHLSHLCL
jgi:hypothetical protein